MADIDNLSIQISANVGNAIETLNNLAAVLRVVNEQLDRIDPSRLANVGSTAESMSNSMSRASQSASQLATNLNNVGNQAGNMAKIGDATQNAQQAMQNVGTSAQEATRRVAEAGNTAKNEGGGGFREMASHIFDAVRKMGSASTALSLIGRVIKGYFAGLTMPIKLATKAMSKFSMSNNVAKNTAKSLVKELTRVTKMLKLMVTRMALRAVIKEVGNGFKSLALHSEEFNNSVSSIMNASKQLGYSFAAMVSPLINAFAPAIVKVINLLIKLANVINQVFAALTGASSWNKAKEFTDDWADDIKAANKEAKKLKKTVLGFDELNQLQEKTTGADTSKNIVDMFETMKVNPKWKEFADWLKDMWKLGDFSELGKRLGKGLRDLLESIPWDSIRKTANKLGGALATLINGFVEVERLGYDIGKTIAQSINTVFEFLNGFVHKLHWDSIGKFLGETFNGFFENIDWPLIKDTVVTGMAGIAEALQNFIETFNWDNISNFIINAIDVICSGIKSFVDGIDWQDLGVKIGDQLNKVMEGVDWHAVGDTLGSVLEAAIDWAYGLVTTFNVDDAVQALSDFLDGVCDKVDFEKAGVTLGTALHKLIGVIQGFWGNEENRQKIKQAIFDFFEGIFNSMTEDDWKFIEGTVGALALIGVLKGLVTSHASGILITLTVALAGWKLGGWIGKILTGDEVYDEYPITMQIKWAVDEWPSTLTEFGEKVVEWSDAWHSMMEDSNAFISGLTKGIDTLMKGPVGAFLDNFLWKGFKGEYDDNASGNGGAGAGIDEEEWKRTIEAAREAGGVIKDNTEAAKAFKKEVDSSNASMAGMPTDVWNRLYGSATTTTNAVGDYTDKLKNAITETNKLKTSTDNANTSYNNLTTGSSKVKTALEDIKTGAVNSKNSLEGISKTQPVLSESMQKICTSFDTTKGKSEDFGRENTVVWEQFNTETANAADGFGDTATVIEQTYSGCADDLKKKTDEISKNFTEEKWTFSDVAKGLKKSFEQAEEGIKGVWNRIADKLNGEYEIGSSKFKIDFPKFAGGGFPENGLFMANSTEMVGRFSNGKTAVANNAQIVDGIAAGVYNAVSSAMAKGTNNNGGYIANTIVVDGEVIARTVTRAQERQNMRYSPSMG